METPIYDFLVQVHMSMVLFVVLRWGPRGGPRVCLKIDVEHFKNPSKSHGLSSSFPHSICQNLSQSGSPPARWGLLDFMSDARLLALVLLPRPSSFFLPRHLVLPRPSSSFLLLAGSHLPALDRSEPRRISSASSWSQWASPDLICQLLIAVSLAGSHLPALDRSGARRTSTGEGLSAVGHAGLQPARVGAPWASPDFNWRGSESCGPRRTSTGEIRRAVGLAGLQPARFGAPWASPDFNRTSTARHKTI